MKNTLLQYNYDEIDSSDYEGSILVSDYTSKNTDLYQLIQELKNNGEFNDFFAMYKIDDNDKLERISYSLYKTPDYWDLLLQINNLTPLFQMPYSYDTLMDLAEAKWEKYSNSYFQSPLSDKTLERNTIEEINKMVIQNEKNRYIYIIRTSKINEFLKILRERDFI